MNKVTIEYEYDGQQCVAVANFDSFKTYIDSDTVKVIGGKDNTKLFNFSTNTYLEIKLINPSNMSISSVPLKEKEEKIEIDYVVVPEKSKKKRKRKKKKKRKFDNGRKTN